MDIQRQRSKALKTLSHILLYLDGREGHEAVRSIYIAIRGPYDFRRTGHSNAKCCERYRRKAAKA